MEKVNNVLVYESKYGFHPCDKDICFKLKELNKYLNRSKHLLAKWHRWARKEKQNRYNLIELNEIENNIFLEKLNYLPISLFTRNNNNKINNVKDIFYIDGHYGSYRSDKSSFIKKDGLEYSCYMYDQILYEYGYLCRLNMENNEDNPLKNTRYEDIGLYIIHTYDIEDNYRKARYPALNKDSVAPLSMDIETINTLYDKIKENK